nr:hypothetical protein [Solimonas variicoloris]
MRTPNSSRPAPISRVPGLLHEARALRGVRGALVVRHQRIDRQVAKLGSLVAEQACGPVVGELDAAIGVDQHHRARHDIEHRAQPAGAMRRGNVAGALGDAGLFIVRHADARPRLPFRDARSAAFRIVAVEVNRPASPMICIKPAGLPVARPPLPASGHLHRPWPAVNSAPCRRPSAKPW